MNKYKVILTPLALEHLQRIAEYITNSFQAPGIALRWLDRMEWAIASLETMPLSNVLVEDEPWHSRGVRRMFERNYFVYYVVDEAASVVRVLAVVYARRDQHAQLGELLEDDF